MPDFEPAEYSARLSKAQVWMAEVGLDALFFSTEPEIRYFAGFRSQFWQSPTRPWYLIIPAGGDPIAIIPAIGAALMAKTIVTDIRTWPSPTGIDDGLAEISHALAPFKRVGAMMGAGTHQRMPMRHLISLTKRHEFIDCSEQVLLQRAVKSDAEIAAISTICAIASQGFEDICEWSVKGQGLDAVFRRFKSHLLDLGAEDVPYLVGGAGQGGYSDVISPPGPQELVDGDILMLDTGASLGGYFCDFDRNFVIGKASNAAISAHHRLWDATQAAYEMARPGVSTRALFDTMVEMLGGGSSIGRMGHGLGAELTEWPSLIGWQDIALKAGMVITLEPSVEVRQEVMLVHEENIVITQEGAQLLSRRAPYDLPVLA